jgi:hypothetical protein
MCEVKRSKNTHYKIINGEFIEKKSFENENEAIEFARFLNTKPNIIYKVIAYKCDLCGKWHVGKGKKRLFSDDRKKYNDLIKINDLIKKIKS